MADRARERTTERLDTTNGPVSGKASSCLSKLTGAQQAVAVSSFLYAAVFILVLVLHPWNKKTYEGFFNTYQAIPPLFSSLYGVIYFIRGPHSNRLRRTGWLMIALGCLSFAIGQMIWTYYETIRGIEVPFPSWADAGYLGAYPLLILGVILLFESANNAGRARLLLDSAIASSSVGLLSWYYLVRLIWAKSDLSLTGKLISVAYPLGDIAGLFCAIVLIYTATRNPTFRRAVYCVAAGLTMLAFGDSTFTYYSLHNAYHTGGWSDWAWSFGWMSIGFAFLYKLWWGQPFETEHAPSLPAALSKAQFTFRISLPYIAVTLVFMFVAITDYRDDHRIEPTLIAAGVGLVLLVILRQVFTLLENQHLTAQLRGFNENLERAVETRTQQLSTLNRLAREVNNTLEIDQVLHAAIKHTRQAIPSDAIVLRVRETDRLGNERFPIRLHEGFDAYPGMLEFVSSTTACDTVERMSLEGSLVSTIDPRAACLRAPLRWQGQTIGTLGVLRWNGEFNPTDPEMLESIGLEVGTALENARLYGAAVKAADHDSVTGLLNHRAIHQRLDKALERAASEERTLTVMMVDIDNFKLFNDTYGHPVGDQVLKRVSAVLQDECRSPDLPARYGGDEFLLVLPDTNEERAGAVAARLQERLLSESFFKAGDERIIPLALSFGIAAFPEDGTNRHELLTVADSNLYIAKQSDSGIAHTPEIRRSKRQVRDYGSFNVLDGMVTAVDNKDSYTRRHSEDVTEFALWIAEELGLSDETMRVIRIGGLLHDVGKIAVPDEILRKPGKLTPEEFNVLKQHTTLGEALVQSVPGMQAILHAVRSHHERWDGRGYPDALGGEDIPYLGRLLAVADAFSAMTTDRPYRKALSFEVAVQEIREGMGAQFDPQIAQAFLRAIQTRRAANRLSRWPASDGSTLPRADVSEAPVRAGLVGAGTGF